MNKKEEFLTIFMREMLPILLKDVPSDQVEEMKIEYFNKINSRYDKFILNPNAINLSAEELSKRIIKGEKESFADMTLQQKQQIYLRDEKLDELYDLSMTAYNAAINYNDNKIIISDDASNNLLSQIEELTKRVKEYNRGIAAKLLSEASLDLRYASGQTEATSFRFHDYIDWKRDPK